MQEVIRRKGATLVAGLALTAAAIASVTGCSSSGSGSASSAAASAASSSTTSPSGTVISLKSLMFAPGTLHIKAGTTVTWKNDEPITHTVTSGRVSGIDKTTGLRSGQKPDGLFNKRLAGQGDSFSYTFTKPGRYSYYCDIHYGMNATIVVTP